MRNVRSVTSMMVGMFLMPVSAMVMASSSFITSADGSFISILGIISIHPITLMMILGIVVQGLAECFISPRYLEYFSLQAPKGDEGLYLGFSHLHSFLSSLLGFGISGYLLTMYCPDPKTLSPQELVHAYNNANYVWYYFAVIGFTSAIALIIYRKVYDKIDAKKQLSLQ
jgi:dipeptide/tripeptide permease